MKTPHYKLHKVKKQWVAIAVTTMAGLSLMTVGTTSSVSADSQPQDSQAVQVTQNDQSVVGDGAQVSNSEQPIQAEESTTNSQSASAEEVTKANQPQAGSIATQDDHQDSPELNQTTADSGNPRAEGDSVTPASDGGVVYAQSPQLVSQSEQSTTTTKGITEKQISEPVPVENRVTASDAQRAEINKILDDHSSGISTLDAAALTLEFEKARLRGATDVTILAEIQKAGRVVPNNLTYLSDFYDHQTGTSGTAFRDKASNKVIIAYTATNNDGNELQDAMGADLIGIGLARGQHYQPAYDFYDKIAGQYGAGNIVITGHSLGGNVAQRVALKKNVAKTIVYNAAPLYIPSVAYLGNKAYDSLREKLQGDFSLPSNKAEAQRTIADIKSDIKAFTGDVIRITTQKDWLNNAMRWLGAVYLGKEYVIPNSGNHDLKTIAEDAKQVANVKQWTTI